MKKAEMLAALEGIDPNVLWGRPKNKEITILFLHGVPNKEIGAKYGLSVSRISQIVARQARRALFYKSQKLDLEYQALVEQYVKKITNTESVVIQSCWENESKHLMAVSEARNRVAGGEKPVKSYILRIELIGSDPLIWRRVIMPAGATFNRLHDVIQGVTNFRSGYPNIIYHLFRFELKEDNICVTNDEETYAEHLKVRKPTGLKIDDYLERHKEVRYIYDFGDDWQFNVRLENIVDDYYFGYPTLLDGAETAPPEDVGGIPGFYEFLEIYGDERHPEHEEIVAWAKEQYFREYNADSINESLKNIKYKQTDWDNINHDNYKIIEDKYRKK